MLMRGKLEILLFEGKLEIKSPGENKRNRGNHGIIELIHAESRINTKLTTYLVSDVQYFTTLVSHAVITVYILRFEIL